MPIIEALHGMAATAWVGGIFFAYMALRPAAMIALEAPQRPVLWQAVYSKFFPLVWLLIAILLITGYSDLFMRLDGFSNSAIYLKLMHGIVHCYGAGFRLSVLWFVPKADGCSRE